jgi:hypothetical protein
LHVVDARGDECRNHAGAGQRVISSHRCRFAAEAGAGVRRLETLAVVRRERLRRLLLDASIDAKAALGASARVAFALSESQQRVSGGGDSAEERVSFRFRGDQRFTRCRRCSPFAALRANGPARRPAQSRERGAKRASQTAPAVLLRWPGDVHAVAGAHGLTAIGSDGTRGYA